MRVKKLGWTIVAVVLLAGAVAAGGIAAFRARPRPAPDVASLNLEQLRALAKKDPHPLVEEALVQRLLVESQPGEALAVARQAAKRYPHNSAIQNALGIACAQNDLPSEAREAFLAAVAANPRGIDAYLNLGRLAELLGDHQLALVEYDRATAVDPTSAAAWTGLGQAHTEVQQHALARKAFETALKLEPDRVETLAAYGVMLAEQENGREARKHLLRALEMGHRSGKVYASLASACADQPEGPEDLQTALKYAAEARKLGDRSTMLFYSEGLALQRLERYREAIEAYRRCINQSLTATGAWIGISQCYRALGDREKAAKAARMGEKILNERQRLANIKHQIRSNPGRLDYREQYAEELLRRQNYLLAADQFRYIAQHRPEQPREWLKVARALEMGGEKQIAGYLRNYVREQEAAPAGSNRSPAPPFSLVP